MLIVSLAVAALTMVLAVRCVLERKNRKDWVRKKIVHLPFFLAGIGMVCGGIFLPAYHCLRPGRRLDVPVFCSIYTGLRLHDDRLSQLRDPL